MVVESVPPQSGEPYHVISYEFAGNVGNKGTTDKLLGGGNCTLYQRPKSSIPGPEDKH